MIHISFPEPAKVLDCWAEIEPFVQLAIDHSNGELSMQRIKNNLGNKEIALGVIIDTDIEKIIAVVTFDMITFDSGLKVLTIQCAGGERMDDWIDQVDALSISMARRHDCDKIYIIGRKGWERKLRDIGYKHAHTTLTKEVY